ncbi:MAG: cytochrome c [bacterium]|nr:MAG: cytochrome c [bacterium]
MVRAKVFLVLFAVGLFAAGSLAVAQDFDMETASQLFEAKCSRCHSVDRPKGKSKTRDEWSSTVKRMQGKMAGWFSDEEAETIIEYLSRAHGK